MRQSLSTFSSENPSDGEEGTASEPSPSGTPEVGSTNTDERPDERSDDMCSQGSEIPLDPPSSEVVTGREPSSLPIPHHNLLRGEQVSRNQVLDREQMSSHLRAAGETDAEARKIGTSPLCHSVSEAVSSRIKEQISTW